MRRHHEQAAANAQQTAEDACGRPDDESAGESASCVVTHIRMALRLAANQPRQVLEEDIDEKRGENDLKPALSGASKNAELAEPYTDDDADDSAGNHAPQHGFVVGLCGDVPDDRRCDDEKVHHHCGRLKKVLTVAAEPEDERRNDDDGSANAQQPSAKARREADADEETEDGEREYHFHGGEISCRGPIPPTRRIDFVTRSLYHRRLTKAKYL